MYYNGGQLLDEVRVKQMYSSHFPAGCRTVLISSYPYLMLHNSMPLQVHIDAVAPPPRPTTVPQALQQSMPLAEVLNLISKPPGSAPPFIPYKPVPYLVPLPAKHTLTVKRPNVLTSSAFGDLREDNLQLVIQVRD